MDEAWKVLIGTSSWFVSRHGIMFEADLGTRISELALDKDHWVYVWMDGVYSGLRAEQTKLCALVVIGVNEHGEEHFLANK